MAESPGLEESAESLTNLSISDKDGYTDDPSVTTLEEEQYVKACLDKATTMFRAIQAGDSKEEGSWPLLERELAIEIEYTSWPLVSDETVNKLTHLLVDVLRTVGDEMRSQGVEALAVDMFDCAFSVIDVLDGLMHSRFIMNEGEELERPFDADTSLAVYRALVRALQIVVMLLNEKKKISLPFSTEVKSFTIADERGMETVFRKSRPYDPLAYLLVVLTLLSHTAVQTDVTCFWWKPDVVVEEFWTSENLKGLLLAIDTSMDVLARSEDEKDQEMLTSMIDRWSHTLHGIICTDSIGRQIAVTIPEEDAVPEERVEKPSIEALTGVSTYLGRWMDVRCLPCTCHFCGVQKAAMEAMMGRWDKRLAHRLIDLGGVSVIGRVAFWMLRNFRRMEASGDLHGEDLYRTCVALNTQVVHLCVMSDYDCKTVADEGSLRSRAVKQAIDSGFLNFLLGYFIPRKLCRLEDRRSETTEDQNRARRLARISCKNCTEFLLLSPDGWITDTCYNAMESVRIESFINERMAPAAQRLVELWHEDKEQCRAVDELVDHYAPFFLKLCEIIRLSSRYGQMKDLWSQELLNSSVDVLANFTWLKLQQHVEGCLPAKKTLLCAMATFCDMCHPSFGARDHFHNASRAVHDCSSIKTLLDLAKVSKSATSCIRAMSYVTRVELVLAVSVKNAARPEQTMVLVCSHCHRPPTLERPLRQCSRCKAAYYCSTDCQRLNWRTHERECVPDRGEEGHKKQRFGSTSTTSGTSSSSSSTSSLGSLGMCAQCDTGPGMMGKLMRCGRCREVAYCSRACQMKHWDVHKGTCREVVGNDTIKSA